MLDFLAKKRVFLGFVFLAAVFFTGSPRPNLWWLGFLLAIGGEGMRTWSSGYIFKNEQLAVEGPYSLLRNPLYFGSFFLGFGIVLMSGNLWLIGLYPLMFMPIYLRRIQQEEQDLIERFGEDALAYFARVPRLVPQLSLYRHPTTAWNLHRAIVVHREWVNWIVLALFAGWFYLLWNR